MELNQSGQVLGEVIRRQESPLSMIYAALGNAYLEPLARLIAGQRASRRCQRAWEYKSLARAGREAFVKSTTIAWSWPDDRWQKSAIAWFFECFYQQLWFHEEGLLFYVRDGDGFRVAKAGDSPYDFVLRLIDENAVHGLEFCKPPRRSEELFLYRANYDAYRLIWNVQSEMSGSLAKQQKQLRYDAVMRETGRLAGIDTNNGNQVNRNDALDDKRLAGDGPIRTRQRRTLLTIIAALCRKSGIDTKSRGANAAIAAATAELGVSVSDDSIRVILEEIPDAVESR